MPTPKQQKQLHQWYLEHFRPLPWRKTKDPYSIWLSETMLQQTTTQAVIPYYEKFLERFPKVEDLAQAPVEEVLEMWAGLGYYSRARNLHTSAQFITKYGGFPKTHVELLEFPGFGPYTARAVASLAFGENVGVLDGNVIRILCRIHGLKIEWWKTKERTRLQDLSDQWVKGLPANEMNQAMMELGATICTPKSPSCMLCPLKATCKARISNTVAKIPLPKPRKAKEVLYWRPQVRTKSDAILLDLDHGLPFLKTLKMPPGRLQRLDKKPTQYDFKHSIMNFDIFVLIDTERSGGKNLKGEWIQINELSRINPSSILKKLLTAHQRRAGSSRSS